MWVVIILLMRHTVIQLYVAQFYVSVFILFLCRQCGTVICSLILCEWLLYCSCVVTVIQLYVSQWYVSVYYIVRVSSLCYSYIRLLLCELLLYVSCFVTVTLKCSVILCDWLLSCSYVVIVLHLYVAQCYMSGHYIVHVSKLRYSYM